MDPMTIAGSIVLVIGAVTTATVTILVAFGKMKAELVAKTEQIHEMVNGKSEAAAAELRTLQAQVLELHKALSALQALRMQDAQQKG